MNHETSSRKTYCIDISNSFDLDRLKSTWRNLEAKNNELSFFHAWEWLETWLQVYKPQVQLVTAKYKEETVAIGLLCESPSVRHHIIKSNQIGLFQTGNQDEDQIWIEYNDFLCHPNHQLEATNACLDALLSHKSRYDEIVISMMAQSRAESLMKRFNHTCVSLSAPTYKTNLQQLLINKSHFLESLSGNTRYQVNYSNRKYEKQHGLFQLSFAKNTEQALEYWSDAGELHIRKWHDSGFKNSKFVKFHKEFIMKSFDTGLVDMVKITAGNHLVAIIYNIIYKKNVYFYLQGIHAETDGKLKPGLTAHSLLMEHYLQLGMNTYDFMGGYSQYKKQLSQTAENLLVIKIQKPLLKFRVENIARSVKQKYLSLTKSHHEK